MFASSFEHVTASGDTVVYSGPCCLHSIIINKTAAAVVSAWDNASAGSGSQIMETASSPSVGPYVYNINLANGIVINLGGAGFSVTVTYSKA